MKITLKVGLVLKKSTAVFYNRIFPKIIIKFWIDNIQLYKCLLSNFAILQFIGLCPKILCEKFCIRMNGHQHLISFSKQILFFLFLFKALFVCLLIWWSSLQAFDLKVGYYFFIALLVLFHKNWNDEKHKKIWIV